MKNLETPGKTGRVDRYGFSLPSTVRNNRVGVMTPQKYVPILIVWRFFGLAPVLQTILQNSTFRRFILWAILLKVLFTGIFKTEFATISEQKPSSHYLTQWWLSNRQLIVAVLHKTGLNFPWINMPKIHVLWYPFVTLCLRAGYTERLTKAPRRVSLIRVSHGSS